MKSVTEQEICHGTKSSSNPRARDGAPDIKALHRMPSCCCVFVSWNRFEQPLFGHLRDTLRIPDEETVCPQGRLYPHHVQGLYKKEGTRCKIWSVNKYLTNPHQIHNPKNETCLSRPQLPLPGALLAFLVYLVHNLVTDLATHLAWLPVIGADRGGRWWDDGQLFWAPLKSYIFNIVFS